MNIIKATIISSVCAFSALTANAQQISNWSTSAGSNNAASPNGAPEGIAPSGVNNTMRQNMAAVRTWYELPEWVNLGNTLGTSTSTAFFVTGDVTSQYHANRRIRATGTTPFDIFGTITASSYSSPSTTVTTKWDSGGLDSTLNAVYLSGLRGDASKSTTWPLYHNLAAAQAPATTSDTDQGYSVGSIVVDTTNDKAYINVDKTDGAAVWKQIDVTTVTSGMILVTSGTVTAGTSATITGLDSTYDTYKLFFPNLRMGTSGAFPSLGFSSASGAVNSLMHYHTQAQSDTAATYNANVSTNSNNFILCQGMGVNARDICSAEVTIHNPGSSSLYKGFDVRSVNASASGGLSMTAGAALLATTTAITTGNVVLSGGTITTDYYLYGLGKN